MKTLGIDCSSNSFAYALIEHSELQTYGELKFDGDDLWKRLKNGISRIKELNLTDIDLIIYEEAVLVNNMQIVIKLAYSFGAMIATIGNLNLQANIEGVTPLVWQRFIGNKPITKQELADIQSANLDKSMSWVKNAARELRKQRTIDWVELEYKVLVTSNNISDAIAIAHFGANR